jgi:hypothetical protein
MGGPLGEIVRSWSFVPMAAVCALGFLYFGGKAMRTASSPAVPVSVSKFAYQTSAEAFAERARQLGENEKGAYRTALAWDFGFIPFYTTLFALLCAAGASAVEPRSPGLARACYVVAYAQWAAGIFDVMENSLFLRAIGAGISPSAVFVLRASTVAKFGLTGLGLVAIVSGAGVWLYSRVFG